MTTIQDKNSTDSINSSISSDRCPECLEFIPNNTPGRCKSCDLLFDTTTTSIQLQEQKQVEPFIFLAPPISQSIIDQRNSNPPSFHMAVVTKIDGTKVVLREHHHTNQFLWLNWKDEPIKEYSKIESHLDYQHYFQGTSIANTYLYAGTCDGIAFYVPFSTLKEIFPV